MRQALLTEAERLLETRGLTALTLRAVAREAGVSHAAPKNHFGSLSGLLSALAADGMTRLATAAGDAIRSIPGRSRLAVLGSSYVTFALEHSGMFALMFRNELLDRSAPDFGAASEALFDLFASASGASSERGIPIESAEQMALAWGQVHGLAVLLVDGRLEPLLRRIEGAPSQEAFVERLLSSD